MNQNTWPESVTAQASAVGEPAEQGFEYCSNCGAKLAGLYCHQCGQSSKSMIKFFGEVVKELLDDSIGYDSRIKHSIMPLLCKPGRITLDYINGKRFYYVLPFRLYLITSLILILLVKGAANTDELKFDDIVTVNGDQAASQELQQEIDQEVNNELNEINKALNQARQNNKENAVKKTPTPPTTDEKKQANGNPLDDAEQNLDVKESNQAVDDVDSLSQSESITEEDSDKLNLKWNSETKQLEGIENLEESWFKTFLVVINPKIKTLKADPQPLIDAFFEALPYMMFIILPIFAIFLKLFYAFSKRYYIEHLVFLLHNHAFIYMVMMLEIITEFFAEKLYGFDNGLASSIATGLDWFGTLLFYWMIVYVFLAMKRFYRQGWAVTIFKTLVLGLVYCIMISIGFMMTLAYGAYQA
jgi:hypothetical protein